MISWFHNLASFLLEMPPFVRLIVVGIVLVVVVTVARLLILAVQVWREIKRGE